MPRNWTMNCCYLDLYICEPYKQRMDSFRSFAHASSNLNEQSFEIEIKKIS